jgi:hypothetical protein
MKEAAATSETLANLCQITQRYIREDCHPQIKNYWILGDVPQECKGNTKSGTM